MFDVNLDLDLDVDLDLVCLCFVLFLVCFFVRFRVFDFGIVDVVVAVYYNLVRFFLFVFVFVFGFIHCLKCLESQLQYYPNYPALVILMLIS